MPDTPAGFSDDTVDKLGVGIDRYFKGLYPNPGSLPDRLRIMTKYYGGQDKAGAAIGISARTIRRWLTGRAVPIRRTLQRAERAYLRIHLQANGFKPANRFERELSAGWSAGLTPRQLGRIAEDIMNRQAKVPSILTLPKVPIFERGMTRMWAPDCTISDSDNRDHWPFNVGNY